MRDIAPPAAALAGLHEVTCRHLHPGTVRAAVRPGPHQVDDDEGVPAAGVIAQERRRAVEIVDDDIDVAIVVQIPERGAAAHARLDVVSRTVYTSPRDATFCLIVDSPIRVVPRQRDPC